MSRVLPLLLLTLVALSGANAAPADVGSNLLPETVSVMNALRETPAVQAARRDVDAEQSVHRQYRIGPHEWVATANAARRNESRPASERTVEWELGLERAVRLPGKDAVYDRAGRRRVEQAQSALQKVWFEQARMLLDRHAAWLREREIQRTWHRQTALLRLQVDAAVKRQRLGDAAAVELQHAEAAASQAEAQLAASTSRLQESREALTRLFPGLTLPTPETLPAPTALDGSDSEWVTAQVRHSPELSLAQSVLAAAQAQLGIESAEARPDPTIGVRVGSARSGAEKMVGLVLSVPFGGDYRAAGTAAANSRAEAARWQQADARLLVEVKANQRLRETQSAFTAWERHADAAHRLTQVADSMARGYRLGEGSLAELLAARRLANEQQLAAATGLVDAWLSRYRLLLEAGTLWPLTQQFPDLSAP